MTILSEEAIIRKWHSLFEQCREPLEDGLKPGSSIELTTPALNQKVEKVILDDVRLKKKQLAEIENPIQTSIPHDHLDISKASARNAENAHSTAKTAVSKVFSFFLLFLNLSNGEMDGVFSRIVTGVSWELRGNGLLELGRNDFRDKGLNTRAICGSLQREKIRKIGESCTAFAR